MEWNMPGWIVSPLFWKSHMTEPQARAANREKAREFGGIGFTTELASGDWGEVL